MAPICTQMHRTIIDDMERLRASLFYQCLAVAPTNPTKTVLSNLLRFRENEERHSYPNSFGYPQDALHPAISGASVYLYKDTHFCSCLFLFCMFYLHTHIVNSGLDIQGLRHTAVSDKRFQIHRLAK